MNNIYHNVDQNNINNKNNNYILYILQLEINKILEKIKIIIILNINN